MLKSKSTRMPIKKASCIKPRKRFGQHFLVDPNIIQEIIHLIQPNPDDAIIEIGPGLGALTIPILKHLRHLTVIELDRDLANLLAKQFSTTEYQDQITLYTQDALKFNFSNLFQTKKLRIIGNLPYNISTPLLFHLLTFAPIIEDMHFMLQKEVVDRMTATPNTKAYGRLTVMIQCQCQVQALCTIEPHAFRPAPKVLSKIIRLIPYTTPPHPIKNLAILQEITTQAFSQRRKILLNTLKNYLTPNDFEVLSINPQWRPEALSVRDFINISNYVATRT